jgi:hypothetical protein
MPAPIFSTSACVLAHWLRTYLSKFSRSFEDCHIASCSSNRNGSSQSSQACAAKADFELAFRVILSLSVVDVLRLYSIQLTIVLRLARLGTQSTVGVDSNDSTGRFPLADTAVAWKPY